MSKYNDLDCMMLDIVEYGEEQIYLEIERIKKPIQRFQQRRLYEQAMNRLKRKFFKKEH